MRKFVICTNAALLSALMILDFDQLQHPSDPQRLKPGYDSGDHIPPPPAGYRAFGEAIPLVARNPSLGVFVVES